MLNQLNNAMLCKELEDYFHSRFKEYTPIQAKAIPVINSGKDTLIIAPTGSGKTEACFLPLLSKIHEGNSKPISILYISPLKSLNRDLIRRLREWAHVLNYRVAVRHGDTSTSERNLQSRNPANIFITTPETLGILLTVPRYREYFKNISGVIVDELHEVISSKRGLQLSLNLTRLREITNFQIVGASATLTNVEESAKFIFQGEYECVKDKITVAPEFEIIKSSGAGSLERIDSMCKIIKEKMSKRKVLIFTNTRFMAELVGNRLISNKLNVSVHHSSLSKEERERVELEFKENKIQGLVCTSSLELGIDVGDVDLVIHISSPKQIRKALQRVGRSGHAFGQKSKGVIIAHNSFDLTEAEVIKEFAEKLKIEEDDIIFPSLEVLAHSIAGLLIINRSMSAEKIYEYFTKNKKYEGMDYDDFLLLLGEIHSNGVVFYDGINVKSTRRTRDYYYRRLSTIPYSLRIKMLHGGNEIGELDERFVMSLNEGDIFITRGTPWIVLSIEEDKIRVEHSRTNTLAIPAWEGEQIPVKEIISENVMKKMNLEKELLIEVYADMLIIYSFLGTRGNNALALSMASKLTEHFGAECIAKSSPYAIFVKLPYPINQEQLITQIKEMNVTHQINSILNKNNMFGHLFSQSSFFLGRTDKNERYSPFYLQKLSDSVPYKEAKKYFMYRYCDINLAELFIRSLGKKKINFKILQKLSKMSNDVLEHMSGSQILMPEINESTITTFIESVPANVKFICANCGAPQFSSLENLQKKCIKCKSVLLAPVRDSDKKEYSKDELMRRAAAYNSYEKRAIIALATYGVGIDMATKILARMHPDEKSFVLDLLKARDNFIRTKKYWSAND